MRFKYFQSCIGLSIVFLFLVSVLLSPQVSAGTDSRILSKEKLVRALTAWAVDFKINTRQLAASFKPKIASIWSDTFLDVGSARNLKELKERELSLRKLEKLTKNYRLAIQVVYSNNEKL